MRQAPNSPSQVLKLALAAAYAGHGRIFGLIANGEPMALRLTAETYHALAFLLSCVAFRAMDISHFVRQLSPSDAPCRCSPPVQKRFALKNRTSEA